MPAAVPLSVLGSVIRCWEPAPLCSSVITRLGQAEPTKGSSSQSRRTADAFGRATHEGSNSARLRSANTQSSRAGTTGCDKHKQRLGLRGYGRGRRHRRQPQGHSALSLWAVGPRVRSSALDFGIRPSPPTPRQLGTAGARARARWHRTRRGPIRGADLSVAHDDRRRFPMAVPVSGGGGTSPRTRRLRASPGGGLCWAGPPAEVQVDPAKAFSRARWENFVVQMGARPIPNPADADWQQGAVERRIGFWEEAFTQMAVEAFPRDQKTFAAHGEARACRKSESAGRWGQAHIESTATGHFA